jgi:hypothetical protein
MLEDSENTEDSIFLNVKSVKSPSEFMACLGTSKSYLIQIFLIIIMDLKKNKL